jgi:hypothetical protein
MKNEIENEIENETLTLWIARDIDRELFLYRNKPVWNQNRFECELNSDEDFTQIDVFEISAKYFPFIKPGECREATVVLDDELYKMMENIIKNNFEIA